MKTIASVCDGSGVSFLLATVKAQLPLPLASVMIKPKGVTDCMSYEDLSKSEAGRSGTRASLVDLDVRDLVRGLEKTAAACARPQSQCEEPPPFALVQPRRGARPRFARARFRDAGRDHRVRRWPTSPTAIKLKRSAQRMNSWRRPSWRTIGLRLARRSRRC